MAKLLENSSLRTNPLLPRPLRKREALGLITSASPHRIKINRTSLDHLLLGESADIDKVSNGPSITLDEHSRERISF